MAIASIDHFNSMYRTYYPVLCFYAMKMVGDAESAKDIVEEIFTRLILSKREFNEFDNIKAWLYTSTRNASLDYIKQQKHAKERQLAFSLTQTGENPVYDYEFVYAEVLNKILLEIKQLPGNSGKIMEMSYFKGMKNEQIAIELGLSEKTVRNLKSAGLAILRSRVPLDLFLLFLILMSTAAESPIYFS